MINNLENQLVIYHTKDGEIKKLLQKMQQFKNH